jgi:hypothetical protein
MKKSTQFVVRGFALLLLTTQVAPASNMWTPPTGKAKATVSVQGDGVALTPPGVVEAIGRVSYGGGLMAFGGASLNLRRTAASEVALRLPTAGAVGSTAVVSGNSELLAAWTEVTETGRALYAQTFDAELGPVGRRLVLAVPDEVAGSMHQPGLELAWDGKSFGAAWLVNDGGAVYFTTITNGKASKTYALGEGNVAWPQITALHSGFAVAWLERADGTGRIRGMILDGQSTEEFLLPGDNLGAFDIAFDGSEIIVVADDISTNRTDEVVIRFAPGGQPKVLSLGTTWNREYDPSITLPGDGSILVTRALRNVFDTIELSVVRVVGDVVMDVVHIDLSEAQEVRAPALVSTPDGWSLVWADDRAAPWGGRHTVWGLDLGKL